MASKWINKDLFGKFQEQKKQEKDEKNNYGVRRMDIIWPTPEKGSDTVAKTYVGRFLPDPNGEFYLKYHYHGFTAGEKFNFFLCPKTWDKEAFCPFCTLTSRLYTGTAADKKQAYNYKRKDRFVANWFVVDDPRDSERQPEDKMNGTVKLYEFPGKIEMKLKEQITDHKYGLSYSIFDPGPEGYDFILKVLSTKKDKDGRVWPDYSNSEFARRPSAIADNEERIDELMGTTHDLKEYLKSMERDEEDIIAILKTEMLWDLVKDEWKRHKGNVAPSREELAARESTQEEDIDDSIWDDPTSEGSDDSGDSDEFEKEQEDAEISDEELLRELGEMD